DSLILRTSAQASLSALAPVQISVARMMATTAVNAAIENSSQRIGSARTKAVSKPAQGLDQALDQVRVVRARRDFRRKGRSKPMDCSGRPINERMSTPRRA